MRPASRSRSVLSVGICAARICVSDSNWVIREGIRAIADDSLVANIWRSRSLAISVWLVIARAARAIAVTHPQPHNQRSELSSRTRLRGLREPGSGGVSSSAMAPSMDESLKTLAESADSRFPAEASASKRGGLLPMVRVGYWGCFAISEEPNLDQMSARKCLVIVLAAGEGTRMRSHVPKVLHELGGRSLLGHVLVAARTGGTDELAVVVGPDHDAVSAEARRYAPNAQLFEQRARSGTAHAVLMARKAIDVGVDDVLVMFGDTPLVRAETLLNLRAALADGAYVAVLGFKPVDPGCYGRLLMYR